MPYGSASDLSSSLRDVLPGKAQRIFVAAFNQAWREFMNLPEEERERRARKVAWAAVKKKYRKDIGTGEWVLKGGARAPDEG